MKKYFLFVLAAFAFVTLAQSCKKKKKDEDIKAAIEAKIKADPDMTGTTVDVKDGVATIAGVCKDDACKARCEAEVAKVDGVKSVVNNCTVAAPPPPPAPMPSAEDTKIMEGGAPILKDIPGSAATVKDGIVTVTGVTDAAKRKTVKDAFIKAGAKNVIF